LNDFNAMMSFRIPATMRIYVSLTVTCILFGATTTLVKMDTDHCMYNI